ncbi:response regulator transcription factor [Streptomyces sp. NPDC055796]
MRVLVVEDEPLLAKLIADGLRRDGLTVDVAADGLEALEKLRFAAYDVMVLDRDLPGLHGDEVCRQVVAQGLPTRILMLTAAASLHEKVPGSGLGADDYLGKPFAYEELLARVLALGSRDRPAPPLALEQSGIRLDPISRKASRDGRPLQLSRMEFAVLETLMRAGGGVVSGEALIEAVWPEGTPYDSNTVRVTLSRLSTRLGDPPVIETLPGQGYRLSAPDGATP